MYSYVTVGELIAFIIGWNMVLEYLIGTSACACALSACLDALANGAVSEAIGNSVGTIFGESQRAIIRYATRIFYPDSIPWHRQTSTVAHRRAVPLPGFPGEHGKKSENYEHRYTRAFTHVIDCRKTQSASNTSRQLTGIMLVRIFDIECRQTQTN